MIFKISNIVNGFATSAVIAYAIFRHSLLLGVIAVILGLTYNVSLIYGIQ